VHAWGFGVHAFSELTFAIPPQVAAFRSTVGIDNIADTGGCVRARVYFGSTDGKPAYQSPLLIGSSKTVDTGVVRMPTPPKTGGKLILQADPAVRGHPHKADPLNISDKFDWLQPRLLFDKTRLWERVRRYVGPRYSVWRDWTCEIDRPDAYSWGSCPDPVSGDSPLRFLPVVAARGRPLKMSRKMTIYRSNKWLVVDAGYLDGSRQDPKSVTLKIDGEEIAPEKIPIRQYWRRAAPLIFPIEKHHRKEVTVVLTQRADGKAMYWRQIAVTTKVPYAYRLVSALKELGKNDMQVSRGVGLELQRSSRLNDRIKEVVEFEQKGGVANYYNQLHSYYYGSRVSKGIGGVTIGPNWRGGDKGFMALQHLSWVWYAVVTKDSRVSENALRGLQKIKRGPDGRSGFRLHRTERMPSSRFGIPCGLMIRNRRRKEIAVFRIDGYGRPECPRKIKPGAEIKIRTTDGSRYEAHEPKLHYRKSKPIAGCDVKGGTVWEIK